MANNWVLKQKLIFEVCFLMYYCFGQCHTQFPEELKSLDIDQIANQLMSNPEIMNLLRRSLNTSLTSNPRYDALKCAMEMTTIKKSLQNADYWTIKRKLLELHIWK